jgi:hypothetical protein
LNPECTEELPIKDPPTGKWNYAEEMVPLSERLGEQISLVKREYRIVSSDSPEAIADDLGSKELPNSSDPNSLGCCYWDLDAWPGSSLHRKDGREIIASANISNHSYHRHCRTGTQGRSILNTLLKITTPCVPPPATRQRGSQSAVYPRHRSRPSRCQQCRIPEKRAFVGSSAIYAYTDFFAQPLAKRTSLQASSPVAPESLLRIAQHSR